MTQASISVGQLVFRLAGREMLVTTPTNQCTLDQQQSRQLALFFTQYGEPFTRRASERSCHRTRDHHTAEPHNQPNGSIAHGYMKRNDDVKTKLPCLALHSSHVVSKDLKAGTVCLYGFSSPGCLPVFCSQSLVLEAPLRHAALVGQLAIEYQ
jgi:hypothetical protein